MITLWEIAINRIELRWIAEKASPGEKTAR
jgi:hypothetical protein